MPLETEDEEDGEPVRAGKSRAGAWGSELPRGPWWRPATALGSVLLGLGVLTALIGLGTGGYFLHRFLAHDARFRIAGVGNIEARGLSEVSRADLLPIFGEDIGKNIFFVSLNERRQQLESVPWVERATVMRLLPDRIQVQIVERHPVAFVRQGSQIGLVDANGVLLSMAPSAMAQRHYSFPVVTGIYAQDPPLARRQRMAIYNHLIAELDSNGQAISRQISEIDLSDAEDAQVMMPEPSGDILAHFGEDHFLERYQRYQAHIAEWKQQVPHLQAVDLRYENQIVLKGPTGSELQALAAAAASPAENPAPAAQSTAPAEEKPAVKTVSKQAAGKPLPAKSAAVKATAAAKKAKAGKANKAAPKTFKVVGRPLQASAKASAKAKKKNAAKTPAKTVSKGKPKPIQAKSTAKSKTNSRPLAKSSVTESNRRKSALPARPVSQPVLGQ
jgi:cell division protein FtsQ